MHPLILLVNQFKKVGDTAKVEAYLDLQKRLLEFTGLKADDPHLSMSIRLEGDISININARRVIGLVFQKRTWLLQTIINNTDLAEVKQFKGYVSREKEAFANNTPIQASLIRFDFDAKPYENKRLIQLFQKSVLDYLPTASATPFRKSYNAFLFTATMDKQARKQLLNWIEKEEEITEKDLESDEVKKLFNLDDLINDPSVSNSNFTQNEENMPDIPLNQILYGPPGTGKTYHTINKALAIIENKTEEELEIEDRKTLKERFDDYVKEGSIVFTTFHQSMSYEDFIEGIKPQREGSDDQPTITYKVESGVFKRVCNSASQTNRATDNFEEAYENFINELVEKEGIELETPSQKKKFDVRVNSNKNCVAIPRTQTATQMTVTKSMIRNYLFEQKVDDWKPYTIPIAEYLRKKFPIQVKTNEKQGKSYPLSTPVVKLDFETIYQAYFKEMRKRVASGTLIDLPTYSNGNKWFLKGLDEKGDALIYSNAQNKTRDPVKRFKKDLKLIYQAYPNYSDVKTFFQTVKAKDIQERLNIPNVAGELYVWFLHFKEFERVYLHQEYTPDFIPNENGNFKTKKNYVLIIDEINRGNVSQIFGELITLIEEDKRLGEDEALTVTLPYSKEKFGVPSNVYIIGTMNTADRSVEALDTALRRRFSFVEMPPQYDLAELEREIVGFKLSHILQTMNDRIEVLLNKDNLIGHSYFLKVDSPTKLKETMFKNIIPLLQEYFFGDYGKIGLVLGKGFVKEEEERRKVSFATFGYPDTDGVQKTVYELRKHNEVNIEEAIKGLLNAKA